MTERDQSPAGPRQEAPAQPSLGWQDSGTPGGGAPSSGAGASAVGAGGVGSAGGSGTGGTADGRSGSGAHGYADGNDQYYTAPQYSTSPVTVRRPDVLAGLLLILAGIAAGVSLLIDWVPRANGWDLLTDGFEDFDASRWPPPVIVLAGGALLVLGVLMLVPARGHRSLGVLALLVTLPALVGVVVLANFVEFTWDFFELGYWVAVAVPALGLLGAIKAMVTAPKTR